MKVCARTIVTLAIALTVAPMSSLIAQDAGAPAPTTPSQHAGRGQHKPAKVELFLGYSRFGSGSNFSTGTDGNRIVGLNGGSAAIEFNLNRHLGIVGDFGGYDSNKLTITGTGVNQPRDVDASGTAYTYMFGPRLHFLRDSKISPFAQVLVGGVHATAITVAGCAGASCTVLPVQNALAMTAGGGIDIPLTQHISLRAVQAEYMMTRFASVPAGGSSNQNDLRLSSGLLFRFGGGMETLPVGLACTAQPTTVFPGDVVMVTSTATNLREKRPATYSWTTNGGVVSGTGAGVQINTVGVTPGTYAVSGKVMQGDRPGQQANCTASFTVHAQEPPTISCSASPESLTAGESSTITAHAVSPQNRPLTYSFSTTSGTVAGNNTAASLSTLGVAPGPITVTCNVVDDLGKSASANSTVTVVAPVAAAPETVAAAPQISNLCAVSFERDRKRPVRVDNEGKACLDDIALQLQHDPAGKLVIVGGSSADEKAGAASERTLHSRRYLVEDKGIDAHRIELRTHKGSGRTVTNVLVPLGAVYPNDDSVIVDSATAH